MQKHHHDQMVDSINTIFDQYGVTPAQALDILVEVVTDTVAIGAVPVPEAVGGFITSLMSNMMATESDD